MAKRFLLASVAALALVGWAGKGTAWGQTEQIRSYRVGITIQGDGSLAVVEQIAYDFGSTEHHGIFRDIPVRFHYDDRYDRVYPVDVTSVTATGGASADYKVQRQGENLDIKIGDPDETVTGEHIYTIAYTVRGALNGFSDHDELYWNATGNEWSVPIDQATVRVTAPAAITKVACFGGPTGSSFPCSGSSSSRNTATFDQSAMGPYNGVTVVVALPKGAVPAPHPVLDERWSLARAFAVTPGTVGVSLGLVLLLAIGVGRLMWMQGRDRRALGSAVDIAYATATGDEQRVPLFEHGTYPVEYAPPEDIRPGQVGTLIDETAHVLDVTATIVDLAVRGYLRIEEIPKRWLLGKPDWRLVQLKGADEDLLAYERTLLNGLFERAGLDDEDAVDVESTVPPRPDETATTRLEPLARVKLSSLRKHFAPRLAKVQDALYADAVKRRWFAGRPDKVRQKWAGRGWILFLVGAGLVYLAAKTTHLGLIALPVPVAGLVLAWGGHLMPRRTAKGTGMVRRVLGFRTYIETAEADEARFAERANLFSQYLPYAVVFGCTEKWARAFRDLDQQQPDWYVSPHPFTLAALSSSIDHFSVTSAGTFTSTPGSSGGSGFGGGGFSGGGGGGGGGGSW
jgi:uncharacterized membrane protein YgcG